MLTNKIPDPDGYTFEFYIAAWIIVGADFTTAIQSFFENGFMPHGVNTIIHSLISKKTYALNMKDF